MIIFTCPKCGHDLESEVLTCYPPIHRDYCPSCGWSHSSREEVVRVPFGDNDMDIITKYTERISFANDGLVNINDLSITTDFTDNNCNLDGINALNA